MKQSIEIRFLELLFAFFLSCCVSFFNEIVFYDSSASSIVSIVFIVLTISFAIFGRFRPLIWLLSLSFVLFATRPRSLHLIEIDLRGSYEYYSPNILKLVGPSVSTSAVFLIFLIVIARAFFSKKSAGIPKYFQLFTLFVFGTLIVTCMNGIFQERATSLGVFLSDLKYLLFIFTGAMIVKQSNYKQEDFQWLIVFLGVVLGFMTLTNFAIDQLNGHLLLQYNHNTYFSIISLGLAIFSLRTASASGVIAILAIFIGAAPIVRGAQLVFLFTVLLAFFYSLSDKRSVSRTTKLVVIGAAIFSLSIYIMTTENALSEFFFRKFAFFQKLDFFLDESTSVRVMELQAIFRMDTLPDMLTLLFGHGLGGTFSLPTLSVSYLTLADFPESEIASNSFSQPHLFLSYWILKYGVMGTALFLYTLFRVTAQRTIEFRLLAISLPALFWQGYWSPGYALFFGFFWAFAVLKTANVRS
ncbi:MAG: hypothetical protein JXQ89_02430 [Pelagimonas sp.]